MWRLLKVGNDGTVQARIRLQMTLALDASHTKVSIMVQEHIRQVNQKDAVPG